jgi:autoinducer 2 (AI-2) kinase
MENKELYDKIKIKWQKAYEVQLKLVDDNITNSMWKAPGL